MSPFSILSSTLWCILFQFYLSLCQEQLIYQTSMTSSQFTYSSSVTFVSDSNCVTTFCARLPVVNPPATMQTKLGEIDTTGYTDIKLQFTFLYANWGLGLFTIWQNNDASENTVTSIAQFDHDDVNQNQQITYQFDLKEPADNNPKLAILFTTGTESNNPTGNLVYIDDIQIFGTHIPTSNPTPAPTTNPTPAPTLNPTPTPTINPTPTPTINPTPTPTSNPTPAPTMNPVAAPTNVPTIMPTQSPTKSPITSQPTTNMPTNTPKPTLYINHMPTMRPTVLHQEVDETTEYPEYDEKDDIEHSAKGTDGSAPTLIIICIILSLIIMCGILYFVYKKYKKKAMRKVSNNLFDYDTSNMGATNIKPIADNIEGEGLEISTNINDNSMNTGTNTATGVDTNSDNDNDNEMDDECINQVNNIFITKGAKSDSSIIIEGEDK
eukprot:465200_1